MFLFLLIFSSFFAFLCNRLRLVEELKLRASSCLFQNEDIYMNSTFRDFIQMCVRKLRGEDDEQELNVDYVGVCLLKSQYLLLSLPLRRKHFDC